MSNAQDLLSILGGGAGRPGLSSRAGGTTSGAAETSILSFRAGKMNTTLKPNGKYLVEPDARRGELHVVWTTTPSAGAGASGGGGTLKVEWKDRRTKTTVNTIPLFPDDDATFERVETGREGDRVYLLQCGNNAESRHFFWMQDKDAEPDEDLCVKVNLYMTDRTEAASAAGASTAAAAEPAPSSSSSSSAVPAGGMDNAELLRIMQGALGSQGGPHDATEGARTSATANNDGQADALGNILESM
eukprot:CAMPEP_0181107008 /NCGR_PEP_ID=MMETSP1071-20121207/16839_1 /TAXON_ID=35127 /ORGANISM="Thalassiosira sp., Strain NH16" /LENGTH=244 /DNA_ID=CAMNT_0023190459 /DNA_START=76 /DNA_END=807 /DNA_ORIENTATION=-